MQCEKCESHQVEVMGVTDDARTELRCREWLLLVARAVTSGSPCRPVGQQQASLPGLLAHLHRRHHPDRDDRLAQQDRSSVRQDEVLRDGSDLRHQSEGAGSAAHAGVRGGPGRLAARTRTQTRARAAHVTSSTRGARGYAAPNHHIRVRLAEKGRQTEAALWTTAGQATQARAPTCLYQTQDRRIPHAGSTVPPTFGGTASVIRSTSEHTWPAQ